MYLVVAQWLRGSSVVLYVSALFSGINSKNRGDMHCESTDGSVQYHILILILYEIPFCAIKLIRKNKTNTSKKIEMYKGGQKKPSQKLLGEN